MILRAALGLVLAAAPTLALGQVGCLPPAPPFGYAPPVDDPELRAMIDEAYQVYIRDTETCLNAESMRTRSEFDAVLKRYAQFSGVEYDQTN